MNLVDRDGNKFDSSNFIYFDKGTTAKIFKRGNQLLKIYNWDKKNIKIINKKLFDIIKNIDCQHIVKLDDYYYDKPSKANKFLPIDAYTMKCIKKENISLLDMDKEYICKVVDQLLEAAYILAYSRICMSDTVYKNIVFNKNGATLIDVDMYYKCKLSSKNKIYEKNKIAVYNYLIDKLDYDNKERKSNYDKVRRLIKNECNVIDNKY